MKRKNVVLIVLATVLALCLALAFVACDKNEEEQLDFKPSGISYNVETETISWKPADVATEYYLVSVNGGEEARVQSAVYPYSANGEAFEVVVSAVLKGEKQSESRRFTPLAAIDDIQISDGGELSWSAVSGATGYAVRANGNDTEIVDTRWQAPAGSNRVKVRPVVIGDDSYFSKWSAETALNVYATPTNVNYDGEKLTWLGNSVNYKVKINGEEFNAANGVFQYSAAGRDFGVEIRAVGDHKATFDSAAASETFHYLQPAQNLIVDNGELHWDEVMNAEGYTVRVDGVEQPDKLSKTVYDKLSTGAQHTVEVKPYNTSGKYFSVWSETLNVYVLPSPQIRWQGDLELDGDANNNIIWDAVSNASGYTVKLEHNGGAEEFPLAELARAFGYAYPETGEYTVRVKATCTNPDICDSRYSSAITVVRLEAPSLVNIVSDPDNVSAGFTVYYTAVMGAKRYQLYKDDTLVDGKSTSALAITDDNVLEAKVDAPQTFTYKVRSMGEIIRGAETRVILSCLSEKALSFSITTLAMPKQLDMAGTTASWSGASDANGYAVRYGGARYTASSENYSLASLHRGTYSVDVCSRGNGSNVLASNYTAPMTVTRLAPPTGIKISLGEGNGTLGFSEVSYAKSYSVYLDGGHTPLPEDSWDNMYDFIAENGTQLSMVSVANYWNNQHTEYYMSSEESPVQQFKRLATPTFSKDGPAFVGDWFVWNAPGNIKGEAYTPTYVVYEGDVAQTGGVFNGTRFSIAGLEGGRSYSFKVKAVGNDVQYLDSAITEPAKEIYKLATPQLRVENGKYCWDPITDASGYVLYINNEIVYRVNHTAGVAKYEYMPLFKDPGDYTVSLYAVGDGGYKTIDSNAKQHVQTVKMFDKPEFSYRYDHEYFTTGGKLEATITKASPQCKTYQYEIAGETITSEQLTVAKVIESTGEYVIRVKARGGVFGDDEIYYLDSEYADTIEVKLLAPPSKNSFSISEDGVISWHAVSFASGYDIQLQLGDGQKTDISHLAVAHTDKIIDFRNYASITIWVRARGNSAADTITSDWQKWVWTNSAAV